MISNFACGTCWLSTLIAFATMNEGCYASIPIRQAIKP